MKAGIESDDPSARATVAEALAGHRTHETVDRLVALLMDENERVRGVAATVLARMDARGPKVLGALVAAIDRPGESARQRISEALATLTRKPWTYDPQAEPASRREVLEAWKQWWAERSGRSR
jgi:HEAT repeat protein